MNLVAEYHKAGRVYASCETVAHLNVHERMIKNITGLRGGRAITPEEYEAYRFGIKEYRAQKLLEKARHETNEATLRLLGGAVDVRCFFQNPDRVTVVATNPRGKSHE